MTKPLVRSIGIPLLAPAEGRDSFWQRLRAAWSESTSLANWGMLEMVKADVTRTPDMEKLPPAPKVYLYGLFKAYEDRAWWTGAAQSANCVLQAVQRRYLEDRFAIIWQRRQALPCYRYPFPFPVHNQSWSLKEEKGRLSVSFSLPGGRVECQLRQGAEYARQVQSLKRVLSGQVKPGELRVCWDAKNRQAVCRFSLKFPAPEKKTGQVLLVRTDPAALWVAEMPGRGRPWILNADHARRWSASHRVFLQRVREDLKREKNATRQARRHTQEYLDDRCRKYRDRMGSFCHQATAQLAGYADRNGAAEVIYDDSERGYVADFPWSGLAEKLAYKLEGRGITFTHVKPKPPEGD